MPVCDFLKNSLGKQKVNIDISFVTLKYYVLVFICYFKKLINLSANRP